jgi:hypothetical protein
MEVAEKEGRMTRGKYYTVAMPVAGILYVVVGLIFHTGIVWSVGALLVGLVAVLGNLFTHP